MINSNVRPGSWLLLLVLSGGILAGCGLLPGRKPIGVAATATARPAPQVLLRFHGRGNAISKHFASPPLGWKAHWEYACNANGWQVTMIARQTRRQFRPHQLFVMHVTSSQDKRTGRGTRTLMYRGNMYIVVQATPRCRWSIEVVQNVD